MCRIPGSDGTFTIVKGGMGAIINDLQKLAVQKGVDFECSSEVVKIEVENNVAKRVILKNGEIHEAKVILSNADPFTTRDLVGRNSFEKNFNLDLDSKIRLGTTMKVNLALNKLPTFKCHPENKNQHNATIHILPQTENPI